MTKIESMDINFHWKTLDESELRRYYDTVAKRNYRDSQHQHDDSNLNKNVEQVLAYSVSYALCLIVGWYVEEFLLELTSWIDLLNLIHYCWPMLTKVAEVASISENFLTFSKNELQLIPRIFRSIKLMFIENHFTLHWQFTLMIKTRSQHNGLYWTNFWYMELREFVLIAKTHLQLQLCTSPVTSLGIVSDLVVGTHSDPLRNWTILLKLLCKLLLDSECFVRWHDVSKMRRNRNSCINVNFCEFTYCKHWI